MSHWTERAPNLWTNDLVKGGRTELRSVAFRLPDGDLVVVSPIKSGPDAILDELAELGDVAFLLAPNHFHNLGLRRYLNRFQDALVVASKRAAPRLHKQTALKIHGLGPLRERLGGGVGLLMPPGTRNGEVWPVVMGPEGPAWFCADAFHNWEGRPTGVMAVLNVALQLAPGLRIGNNWKWIALSDNKAYARWLHEQLEAQGPTLLLPGHGEAIASADLPQTLLQLASRRLP